MTPFERATAQLKSLNLAQLDQNGLGRWDEEYYLAGLYHPLRSMNLADEQSFSLDTIVGRPIDNVVDVYIHVPFCHVDCSFCHFYKEIIPRKSENSLEEHYVQGVLNEIDVYKQKYNSDISPRSIQFGGGTPSALSADALKVFLDGLSSRFDTGSLEEVKFEFHPDMANNFDDFRTKLRTLKEFGLTTAIIDLEATNPKVLKSISRGNTSSEGYRALIEIAKEEGIESVASAYMTGLPHETFDSFQETLHLLAGTQNLDAVNIYPLMFKPSDAVFKQRRRDPQLFSTPKDKDLMMLLAAEILGDAGFSEGPCHFFKKATHTPKQQLAKAASKTLIGLGPASFGYIDGETHGLQYMNYPSLNRYLGAIEEKKTGMWRSSAMNKSQKALRNLMFSLNGFEPVSAKLIEEAGHCETPDRLVNVIGALTRLGLLEQSKDSLSLTRKGQLRNAEIMYFLAERKAVQWDFNDPEFEALRRYEFFPSISRDNELLFERMIKSSNPMKVAA